MLNSHLYFWSHDTKQDKLWLHYQKFGSISTFSSHLPHLKIRFFVRVQFRSSLGNTTEMKDCKRVSVKIMDGHFLVRL